MKELLMGILLLTTATGLSCENTKRMIEHSLYDLREQECLAREHCPDEKEMISFIKGSINAYEFIQFYMKIKEE